ncbi:transposase domain-containing protein [Streptomyces sp. NBC_00233]|uniref:transposase domain-containing protein n=1 Tax=Streptomyces sp. NBC_00233 TaxID=2975686 RepID=UPI00224EAE47|nr:transposase domain-containing protein [Streptomyces sp. NBC_00233]MCX5233409.1 transposase domain-containing protein [Streptomyces sp. NBC_00233]
MGHRRECGQRSPIGAGSPPRTSAIHGPQALPFDVVDAVLEETLTVQRRLRDLPSRVGIYFVLAMCLFPEVGYLLVRQKLTAALTRAGLEIAWPTTKALRDLRRRIGTAPMRCLFDILAGALAPGSIRVSAQDTVVDDPETMTASSPARASSAGAARKTSPQPSHSSPPTTSA